MTPGSLNHLVRDEIAKTIEHRYTEQLCRQMVTPSFVHEVVLFDCLTIWRELRDSAEG
jgi:hypothetical protein